LQRVVENYVTHFSNMCSNDLIDSHHTRSNFLGHFRIILNNVNIYDGLKTRQCYLRYSCQCYFRQFIFHHCNVSKKTVNSRFHHVLTPTRALNYEARYGSASTISNEGVYSF